MAPLHKVAGMHGTPRRAGGGGILNPLTNRATGNLTGVLMCLLAACGCAQPLAQVQPSAPSAPAQQLRAVDAPAGSRLARWSAAVLRQPEDWYRTDEALLLARRLVEAQHPAGGWIKNTDWVGLADDAEAVRRGHAGRPTIDNDATWRELRFLAAVITAGGGEPALRRAVERGLQYLLDGQLQNGGWPQVWPGTTGYQHHVTFNDDAMTGVLRLLHDVQRARAPFAWLEPAWRERAQLAVARGIDCILWCQVRVDGRRLGWGAQHDAQTGLSAAARAFEPASLSAAETVDVVRFLMDLEDPQAEVRGAIEAAVAWLEEATLRGLRIDRPAIPDSTRRDQVAVADPEAPPVWARFYEIGSNRPVFVGRDGVITGDLAEVEVERRSGYRWYGTWPERLLQREYPDWRQRQR